jgi:hypothetical protein
VQGVRNSQPSEQPDFFLRGMPMTIENARAYFLVKNYANWDAPIRLPSGDTWDTLADRLEQRLGYHIWHPWHWQEVAKKPGGGLIFRAIE